MTRFSVRRATPVWVALVLAVVAGLVPALLSPATAATASVTGTITDERSGSPLSGVQVVAVTTGGQQAAWATTDDAGQYVLTVPTGSYRFLLRSGRTIVRWYGGGEESASAEVVQISGPATISSTLRPAGRIPGTLTGDFLGTPLVKAQRADGSFNWALGASTVSGDGHFEAWIVTEQPVHVGLAMTTPERLSVTRWSGNRYAPAHSTEVHVGSGEAVDGLEVDVPAVATVSGRVTNAYDAPVQARLTRHVVEDGSLVEVGGHQASSDKATGAYQALVPAGVPVTLRATGYPGEGFQPTWLGDTTDAAQATSIGPLEPAATSASADIALIGGATLTGTVVDPRSLPVAGVTVTVFRERTGIVVGLTETDARGRFEVPGLGPITTGGMTVRFSGEHLVTTWSDHQANQATAQFYGSVRPLPPQTVTHEADHQLPDPGAPTMTGSGLIGTVLSAAPGAASATDTTEELRWYCGSRSLDVTGPTYVVTAADDGCALHVRQVSLRDGWGNGMADSPSVTARPFAATGPPYMDGDLVPGRPLTVRRLAWTARPDAVEHQWLRNGVPISGATATTYTPRLSDIGAVISVRLTAHRVAEGVSTTHIVRGQRRIKAATALRIVRVVPRWRRTVVSVRITSPGVVIPPGPITVSERYADGSEASVTRLRVTGSPQTVRFTYRSYRHVNRLIFRYPGSRYAAPARLVATVRVR